VLAQKRRRLAALLILSALHGSLTVLPDKHHSFALIGAEEDDAVLLKRSPDLVARRLVHGESILGLDALQSGERYQGLVGERLLIPTKQRAGGP